MVPGSGLVDARAPLEFESGWLVQIDLIMINWCGVIARASFWGWYAFLCCCSCSIAILELEQLKTKKVFYKNRKKTVRHFCNLFVLFLLFFLDIKKVGYLLEGEEANDQ